ncbi:DUF3040 domain-containing protein [Cellulomonas marina]|uniref:DUF3040 domain-containing protein n=1 Tax=Cellulomonas marina TaxID=988821 RepID=A0A1I0VL31_9CELL|nr:DUF3040 domain-containing protein [Cellulomonas marina]GIG27915.1 hypothetical protein Cma02nite_05150 [Cellulomonas marina]SFA76733.1 Protein of unknown function [Cellulomonas marina]
MPLSEYEQRVLEQMERQLTTDDPRLANTLTQRSRRSVGRWVLAGVGTAVGLLLLVLGAAGDGLVLLGVVGFVLMFASVAYAFAEPRRRGQVPTAAPNAGRPAPARSSKPGFMSRMEQRWDRRREPGDR